jgi:hypothetical protein
MEITLVLSERGAQHHDAIRQVIREALETAGIPDQPVHETIIRDDEEALAARCIGSPTIRVDGFDVEYVEREPEERSAGLRYFSTPTGWKPVPEKGMLVRAFTLARERDAGT